MTKKRQRKSGVSGAGRAMNLATEMVAGPLLGVLVGLGFDDLFDTKPLFLIIFFVVGSVGSLLRVYRVAKQSLDEQNAETENTIEEEERH